VTDTQGPTARIWRDGSLVEWADATVHVMAHALHYGSSVFEGMRCYETPEAGAVFRLRDHMRRLKDSAKIYRLETKWSIDELCDATIQTIASNGLRHCYIRPIIMRTGENMGIWPKNAPIETMIICWNMGSYFGDEALLTGTDVRVASWRRAAPNTFPALAKAGGNYLNSQLTKIEAKADDYAEGIMLDSAGFVAEGSGENLFVVRDGVIYTAPLSSGILHGITRDSIMRIAADLGYTVREMVMPREFLYIVDEAFFCGTAAEITPIRSIDQLPVGTGAPGPVYKAVRDRFMGIVKGVLPDPYGWLTAVPLPPTASTSR